METAEQMVRRLAATQLGLVSRQQALMAGMSRHEIQNRRRAGWWNVVHPGVYLLGVGRPTWAQRCRAACLLGDEGAVSHRAGLVVWGLDGIGRAPVEITVPHESEAKGTGVVVHRSRKWDECDRTVQGGIPVSVIPRTLIDVGRYAGPKVVEKALESAIRRRLTNEAEVWDYLDQRSRGLPGARVLRTVGFRRVPGVATGSAAEVELLMALRRAGAPEPVRQCRIDLLDGGVAVVDIGWPPVCFATEVDGYAFHGGRLAHDADLERQNALGAVGWELRRFSGAQVMANADAIARALVAELRARYAALDRPDPTQFARPGGIASLRAG